MRDENPHFLFNTLPLYFIQSSGFHLPRHKIYSSVWNNRKFISVMISLARKGTKQKAKKNLMCIICLPSSNVVMFQHTEV